MDSRFGSEPKVLVAIYCWISTSSKTEECWLRLCQEDPDFVKTLRLALVLLPEHVFFVGAVYTIPWANSWKVSPGLCGPLMITGEGSLCLLHSLDKSCHKKISFLYRNLPTYSYI